MINYKNNNNNNNRLKKPNRYNKSNNKIYQILIHQNMNFLVYVLF